MAYMTSVEAGRRGGKKVRALIEAGKRVEAGESDPISLLKADHDRIRDLFQRFDASISNRLTIAQQVCHALQIHTRLEEALFYPALREDASDQLLGMLDHAEREHDQAKEIIRSILPQTQVDGDFVSRFGDLKSVILDHLEEEENEMFPLARESLRGQMTAMLRQMRLRKKELASSAH